MAKKPKAVWRPMTDDERRMAMALGGCRYGSGTHSKRFARNLQSQAKSGDPRITENQAAAMWRQGWTFRRQIRDRTLMGLILRAKAPTSSKLSAGEACHQPQSRPDEKASQKIKAESHEVIPATIFG